MGRPPTNAQAKTDWSMKSLFQQMIMQCHPPLQQGGNLEARIISSQTNRAGKPEVDVTMEFCSGVTFFGASSSDLTALGKVFFGAWKGPDR
ncbi:hypothetical protein BDBG_16554 [Blastomyces gilchristii SLH14081]|uniref:Uncharacterized protein n=1 Tax=Blastomyces gilchristii (strain SLH14081) TaxID=559298 RepID=A0A179UDN7_BLAGS|nr:uncharacterized protein BDBG_16554 [Blastomyces gilchristii SLH14081]OAT06084.1 hypothetical protein BDBG_16554 [Blastomyces gilchristii SLH14081]